MNRKRVGLGAAVLLIAAAVLAIVLWRPWDEARTADPGKAVQPPPVVRIGAILPLTGPLAYLGEEERNVLLMAQDEINQAGATPRVQISIEDSKSTARDGIAAYQRLRLANVPVIITGLTIVAEAIKPLSEEDRIPQLVLSVHPEIAQTGAYIVRPYYGLETEMQVMADYLASTGAQRVAALYINTPESQVAIDRYFRRYLSAKGISFVGAETYGFTDNSVRSQLVRLRGLRPDHIMTIDFGYMYPTILREAESLGMRRQILGGLGMMTAPPMPPELTEGVVFTAADFVIRPTERYRAFAARYESRYGAKPTFDGVYTYDGFRLIYDKLKDGSAPVSEFVGIRYLGTAGEMTIDTTGTGRTQVRVARYGADGRIVEVPVR